MYHCVSHFTKKKQTLLPKLEFLMFTLTLFVTAPHHFPYKYIIGFSMLLDFALEKNKGEDISLYMDNTLILSA
jgi:hypothetical protein